MNIDEMEEGREMDKLVAKLMGWHHVIWSEHTVTHDGRQVSRTFGLVGLPPKACINSQRVSVPHWSINLLGSWRVLEKKAVLRLGSRRHKNASSPQR